MSHRHLLTAVLLAFALVGCRSEAPEVAVETGYPSGLADSLRGALRTHVLDAWYPRAVDTLHGGFLSDFGADWRPGSPQDKMIVTQARHVWTTSRAALFFPEERERFLALAAHGTAFLRDRMWDRDGGGFVSLVNREGEPKRGEDPFKQGKTAYGNAFAIYALAAYHAASGDTAALGLARRAFHWLDGHAHDPVHGGYFQFVGPDGAALVEGWGPHPAKDQNSSIHLLEAFTGLYGVWPDSLLRDRLGEMLVLVRDTMSHERGYLQLFFDRAWTPVSYRDSSAAVREAHYELDHVSYGHDVETAYLMLEAAHALGLDPAPTLAAGKRMLDHALSYGWDDVNGGLFDGGYYVSPEGPPVVVDSGKAWWAQAEALNAFHLFDAYFPDDDRRYGAHFRTTWAYIDAYLIDHARGGWHMGGLDREPESAAAPKGTIWKAGYHDGRALMEVVRRLERPGEP